MADKVQIELEVLAKKALESVEAFTKDAQKTLNSISISTSVTAIKAGFDIASIAVEKFSSVVGEWIKQSVEAEEAQRKLNNAMRLTGEFSEQATVNAEKFSVALAKVTTASDNQVISALALAKSYGLSNAEARRLVTVAADLAAFMGEDLNSAVKDLSETFGGHVRALQKQFPELEGLTKKQLAFGAAIDAVAKRVKGSAADELETYRGQTIQLRKEIEKAEEGLGNFVTRGLGFWIRKIREAKEATAEFAAEARDTFIRDNLNAEAYAARYGTIFDQVKKKYGELGKAQQEADREATATRKAEQKRLLDAARDKAKEEQAQVKQLVLDSLPERLKIEKEAEEKIALVRRQVKFGLLKKEAADTLTKNIVRKEQEDLLKLQLRIRSEGEAAEAEFEKKKREAVENAAKNPVTQLVKFAFGAGLDSKAAIGVGAGLLNAVTKGAAGAQKLITQAIGDVFDVLLPGIGSTVSEIFDLLAQGPEKVRETVTQFAKAIPQIIENIIKALPVLFETLARELPPALAKAVPFMAERFSIELVKNMPAIIKGFAEGLVEAAKQFVQTLLDTIKSAGGLLGSNGIFGGGNGNGGLLSGSGIPVISQIGDFLGLADGGRIPDLPQYEGDRFPARLNAGEQVLSKDLSSKLDAFLAGAGGGGAPQVVKIMIGQREMARVLLDLNRNGFRTA